MRWTSLSGKRGIKISSLPPEEANCAAWHLQIMTVGFSVFAAVLFVILWQTNALVINKYTTIRSQNHDLNLRMLQKFRLFSSVEDQKQAQSKSSRFNSNVNTEDGKRLKPYEQYDGDFYDDDNWVGNMDGFDWQLERARRLLEGPAFAPIRMTLWKPVAIDQKRTNPGAWDHFKILLNNALQMVGAAESLDGAPLVQGVNTFKGSPMKLLSKVIDGDLAELAGGPLFLLLNDYYKQYGSVFKLAFGPKSFIIVSDPVLAKHILKENPIGYDKGILAEILEPVMGKVIKK